MRLLDRLVLKDLIPYFGTGIALFGGLWFAADPVIVASKYLAAGIPLPIVLHIVGLYLPPILALILPMGMLLAVLQGFGRLSGDSEAVALFSAGIPFARIAAPAAVMGLLVSGTGYVIKDKLASAAKQQQAVMEGQIGTAFLHKADPTDKPYDIPDRDPRTGQLRSTIHVEHGVDPRGKDIVLRDVTVTQFDGGIPIILFHAEEAHWRGGRSYGLTNVLIWRLGEMPAYTFWKVADTDEADLAALNKTPQQLELLHRDPDTLDFAQMRRQIALMRVAGTSPADLRGAETDLWSKIALPFSALVFTVIGSPLGLRPQRSSRTTGWFLAILIIFVYYVLYTAMGYAARGGALPPPLAAFLPNLIGLAVGGALVWKASR